MVENCDTCACFPVCDRKFNMFGVFMGWADCNNWIPEVKSGYVPTEVLDQIRWERDIAMSYLEEAGVGFGEKAELQRVKHGKWIMLKDSNGFYREVCSVCYDGCPECSGRSNYCPNCGATMCKE